MRRDWDLIRTILVEAEKKSPGQMMLHTEIAGYDPLVVAGHIGMLSDAGYLKAKLVRGNGIVLSAVVLEITMPGYDLLDTMRTVSVWEKIKLIAKDKGLELTFEVVKKLGSMALEQILA